MGETCTQRTAESFDVDDCAVAGLRERAWIRLSALLGGINGARIFRRGSEPKKRAPGASLCDLVG